MKRGEEYDQSVRVERSMVSQEGWRGLWSVRMGGEEYSQSIRVKRSMVSHEGWRGVW